ncbi:DUF4906 domain-containing protein [Parabacteroides segnis]|uniref:DUF4906 domain-containing protein n=1 Tax=Parabacteroides segnis TaxID=2763058 RepID=UPI00351510BD
MKTRSKIMLSLLSVALGLTACVEAEIEGGDDGGGTTPYDLLQVEIPTGVLPLEVTDPLDTKVPGMRAVTAKNAPVDSTAVAPSTAVAADTLALPVTRAEGTVYKRAIVLQYPAGGGNLLNAKSTDIDNYAIGASISPSLMESENCNIYVLVVNETTTSGQDEAFSTEAKLKQAGYDLYSRVTSPTDGDIPLFGSLTGVRINRMPVSDGTEKGLILNTDGTPVKAELRRIAAKLAVSFTYEAAGFMAGEEVTIGGIPPTFLYVEGSGNFPTDVNNFTTKTFTISDRDGDNNDQPKTTFDLYLPDNRRGTVGDVVLPTQKTKDKAPQGSTYLAFSATEKKTPTHRLTYRFYFGGNNSSDFNIKRNYVYTLNSAISQTADGDPRVEEGGLKPVVTLDPLVDGVSESQATLKGTVTANDATITKVEFGYKKQGDADMTWKEVNPQTSATATYTCVLTGLTSNTVYLYKMRIEASIESEKLVIESDKELSFSTNTAGMPVLSGLEVPESAVNGLSATASSMQVTGSNVTEAGIVYSENIDFNKELEGERIKSGVVNNTFSVNLTGLKYGTTYYYYYYAVNAQGVVYSNRGDFRTKGLPAMPMNLQLTSTEVDKLIFGATLPGKANAVDDVPSAAGVKIWETDPGKDYTTTSPSRTFTFSDPGTSGVKTAVWTNVPNSQQYWYAFYSTNGVGTVHTTLQSFTSSSGSDLNVTFPTRTFGPQAETCEVTVSRNVNIAGIVAQDGTTPSIEVASGDGSSKIVFNILDYTDNAKDQIVFIAFRTINELPLRSSTATVPGIRLSLMLQYPRLLRSLPKGRQQLYQ